MKLPPAAPMEKRALRTVQRGCCELEERIGNAFEDGALKSDTTALRTGRRDEDESPKDAHAFDRKRCC